MNRSSTLAIVTAVAGVVLLAGPAHAADPTTADCLAASDASLKSGNEHHLRAERAQLLICAAQSCPTDIRKECVRRVDEVNAQIPTIIFEARDASGNDLSAVKVIMDGQTLAERLEGSALSIDPGERTFSFETSGQPTLTKRYVIREAQKDRREAVAFGSEAAAGAATPGASGPSRDAPSPATPTRGGIGTQKGVALAAGGVGLVGLGVGAAFGLSALSKKNDANRECPDQCAGPAGVGLWNDARSAGNTATVAFVAGGVALAGGAVLWLSAGSEGTTARVALGPGSIQLKGTW